MKYFLRSILTLNRMTADFKRSSFVLTDSAFSFLVAGTTINTLVFTSCNAVSNGVESIVVIFICHCQCIRGRGTRGLVWTIAPPLPTFSPICLFLYACVFVLILVETSEIKTTSQVSRENRAQTDAGPPRVLCDSPLIRTS